jgi:hypothetical protein
VGGGVEAKLTSTSLHGCYQHLSFCNSLLWGQGPYTFCSDHELITKLRVKDWEWMYFLGCLLVISTVFFGNLSCQNRGTVQRTVSRFMFITKVTGRAQLVEIADLAIYPVRGPRGSWRRYTGILYDFDWVTHLSDLLGNPHPKPGQKGSPTRRQEDKIRP